MTNIKTPNKPIEIAIFGSCTTRDIFNRKFNPKYKDYFEVVSFQNQTSIMSLVAKKINYTENTLSPLTGWDKTSIEAEFNKKFLSDIKKTQPTVIIIDFFADARFKTIASNNSFITVNEWKTTKSNFYKELIKTQIPFSPTISQLKDSMQVFYDYIKINLPNTTIVLNQARGAKSYTNHEGKEEFFNQKVINKINKRWEMLDNLFIEIAQPLQIDVMTPEVKGYIAHPLGVGYMRYTPNFYHNFLKTFISIELTDQVQFLKSSLATLVPTGIFPEEKKSLLEEIRFIYISLNKEQKDHLDTWLDSRYKEFLSLLVSYNKNIHNYVKFISFAFRAGIKNVIARDISFAEYLLEPVIKRRIFPCEKVSAYANLNYGNIQYHNFITSVNTIERTQYFKKAYYSLMFSYSKGETDYLKNRSAYFLALLYAGYKNFHTAISWYKHAINTPKPAPNIYTLPFIMLLQTIDIKSSEIFEEYKTIFTKKNTTNKQFWLLFQKELTNHTLKNNITLFLEYCTFEQKTPSNWETKKIKTFFSTVSSYIENTIDIKDYTSSTHLQKLYRNNLLTEKGKSNILFEMADTYAYHYNDLSRAILMASESNTMSYTKEKSHFISTLILSKFSMDIRNILKKYPYLFKSTRVNFYVKEQTRNIAAWKRFITHGFASGYFHEEVDFLEFILLHAENQELQKALKTRLAYLYYTGTAGISEDNHETPNISKSKAYFQTIKGNPLVKKYLTHPRLAIYQDMERYLDNKKENYLFFENKKSDELLIVFSCAGSYSRYTQLKVFYEKNKTNILFLNNPPYNWYHGSEWKRIQKIIDEVALKNFKKENIITYFGSMGGYAALRVGLIYSFRTIVFNPQVDLNIWIKHRPAISVRLNKEKKLHHLQEINVDKFEKMPLYYATSSAMEDVEAFRVIIDKISLCSNGLFIFEKIPKNIHEGIFTLLYKDKQQEALLNIAKIQKQYYPSVKYRTLDNKILQKDKKIFWNFILQSMKLRIMVQIADGIISYATVKDNFLFPPKLDKMDYNIKEN